MLIRTQHLNLVRKIAWSFYNTTGMDWAELFSEASLAYCEAIQNYDPEKGKITTYLWGCIQKHLINFTKKEGRNNQFLYIEDDGFDVPQQTNYFFEVEMSMTDDAREISQMIFDEPHLFLSVPKRVAKSLVIEKLIVEKEWSWPRVWRGIRKLKKSLN